jgi:hypothetical protein
LAAVSLIPITVGVANVGWSFTAVRLIVLVTATLDAAPAPSEFASVTDQVTVRLVLVDVGLSEVERYVTLRNAA